MYSTQLVLIATVCTILKSDFNPETIFLFQIGFDR
jgi:hypothetical protein